MRKIAANYIWLPRYPLLRGGYVLLEGDKVVRVVDTGGKLNEIAGLEFYGGLIVAACVQELASEWRVGDKIRPLLHAFYSRQGEINGLALIQGIDYQNFCWTKEAFISPLC